MPSWLSLPLDHFYQLRHLMLIFSPQQGVYPLTDLHLLSLQLSHPMERELLLIYSNLKNPSEGFQLILLRLYLYPLDVSPSHGVRLQGQLERVIWSTLWQRRSWNWQKGMKEQHRCCNQGKGFKQSSHWICLYLSAHLLL